MQPSTSVERKRSTLSESDPNSISAPKRQAIADWVGAVVKLSPCPDNQPVVEFPRTWRHEDNKTTSQGTSQSSSTSDFSIITPYSLDFEPELRRRNIRDADKDDGEPKPANWRQLQELLQQDRTTPEVASEEHRSIRRAIYKAKTEATALTPRLLKDSWSLEPASSVQYNAPWIRHMPIMPTRTPYLSDPKPEVAYGWEVQAFQDLDVGRALEDCTVDFTERNKQKRYHGDKKSYEAPRPDLFWPVVTVEAKGPDGTHYQSHLQNEHSAAIMLNNRLQLKRQANLPMAYDHAVIFTIDIASFIVELNCHWVSAGENGEDVFWGKQLKCWNLHDESSEYFNSARRAIRNCVEWARRNALSEIRSDLTALRRLRLQASSSNAVMPSSQLENTPTSVPAHGTNNSSDQVIQEGTPDTPPTSTSPESEARNDPGRRRKQTLSMDLEAERTRRTHTS